MNKKPVHKILFDKWSAKNYDLKKQIHSKHKDSIEWVGKHGKNAALGALGALLMFSPTLSNFPPKPQTTYAQESSKPIDKKAFLITDLKNTLPEEITALTPSAEEKAAAVLSRSFGIDVSAQIGDKRLNTTYGLIGAEQHLARFPHDNMISHFDNPDDSSKYYSSGMAPGLSAWGYFARSKEEMTKEDSDREKYYIAVQTFLSPGFDKRFSEYRDFYKYRKMLVVNPQNGKAIVADIADAGPAPFTGKHLGGSPEVMKYLERVDGAQKGPVLYYFIKDPNDKVPLGPIDIVQ